MVAQVPEFLIEGTKQATVPVQFLVKADDADEALRQVYDRKVEPMIVGQPQLSWDTTVRKPPRRVD